MKNRKEGGKPLELSIEAQEKDISLKKTLVIGLNEAREKLITEKKKDNALVLLEEAKNKIENNFIEQMAISQKLRRAVVVGISLVGLGAGLQLLDMVIKNNHHIQ